MNTLTVDKQEPEEDLPSMNTLAAVMNKMIKKGYTDILKVTNQGLCSRDRDKTYPATEVKIINFYRFEGESDPADNSILYVIETDDGAKGTLVDAYGPYADEKVTKFITEVEEIHKKAANP
jgi:hypothetical protein